MTNDDSKTLYRQRQEEATKNAASMLLSFVYALTGKYDLKECQRWLQLALKEKKAK